MQNSVLASVTSGFNENFLSSGNAPNEFLEVTSLLNIRACHVSQEIPLVAPWFLDDMTLTTPAASIPEPSTLSLLALGAVLSGSQGLRNRWRTTCARTLLAARQWYWNNSSPQPFEFTTSSVSVTQVGVPHTGGRARLRFAHDLVSI